MSTGQQEAVDAGNHGNEMSNRVGKIEGIPIPRLNFKSALFNFESWRTDVELAFDMVDGLWDIMFDPPLTLSADHKKLDKKAYAYLGYAIGDDGKDLLCPRKETAGALWKKVINRFGRKLLSKELQSLESFLKLTMNSEERIVDYVAKAESSWNEYLTVSGWRQDMNSMTKEMRIRLEHLFFLKLLSGISNHPKRLYGVQLQTLRVQLSEDKLTLNSVVDLISVEEESVNSARGDFSNQIAFKAQSLARQHQFTCHNCGKPNHFFRKCPYPLKKNLKSIVTGKNMSFKNDKFKKNMSNGKSKMKGQVVQHIVESSTSSSSDENDNIKQAGSVLVVGNALNT